MTEPHPTTAPVVPRKPAHFALGPSASWVFTFLLLRDYPNIPPWFLQHLDLGFLKVAIAVL